LGAVAGCRNYAAALFKGSGQILAYDSGSCRTSRTNSTRSSSSTSSRYVEALLRALRVLKVLRVLRRYGFPS